MRYYRPSSPATPSQLVPAFEAAIRGLVKRFHDHPYVFYTETDMHCYLYYRLYKGGLANGLYRTADGRDTILLHKEYPTAERFRRGQDGHLSECESGRRRGAFDICLWDPAHISANAHRKQRVLCAAELALNECRRGSTHTINDATKLASPVNAKYGYLLYFIRDDPRYQKNREEIRRNLENAAAKVRVVLVQVHGDNRPPPEYIGDWGQI